MLGRADDHQALEHLLAAVDEHHRVVAGVDEHVALAEVLRQPAPPLEVGDHLGDAVVDRGVERARGVDADHAVDRQALGLLVALHHHGQRIVVGVGRGGGRRHRQAELAEPRAQHRHAGIGRAGFQQVAAGQWRVGGGGALPAQVGQHLLQRRIVALGGQGGEPGREVRRIDRRLQEIGARSAALLDVDVGVDRVGVDAAGRDIGGIGDQRIGQRLLVAGDGRLVERAGAVPVGIEPVVARRSDCLEERSRAFAGPLELVGPGRSGSHEGNQERREGAEQYRPPHVQSYSRAPPRLTPRRYRPRESLRPVAVLSRRIRGPTGR